VRVCVSLAHRFARTPDGRVWSGMTNGYAFWQRYLDVFDCVNVIARVQDIPEVPSDWSRADGPGVSVSAIPYFHGPWQYLLRRREVKRAIADAVAEKDAFILRGGGVLDAHIACLCRRHRWPYGVEVIGDPYDVFAPGAVDHVFRPFFRWHFTRQQKRKCAGACACAYVTQAVLQNRYPPGPRAFSTHYSSIALPESALVASPRTYGKRAGAARLVHVGSFSQLYKAPDVLLEAVAQCARGGVDLRLVMIGEGRFLDTLRRSPTAASLGNRVQFLGRLAPGEPIRAQLDAADLFVLPSKTEGLPRAMIEAMARGLPCIGSRVGGFPELLPEEDLVPPGNAAALADKIREVLSSPDRMTEMSRRNLQRARQYTEDILRPRRVAFYSHIREATERRFGERSDADPDLRRLRAA